MDGQGPKQGRSHSSDWIHWGDQSAGGRAGHGLVEGLVSVAVLDPGHRGSPTQGCPFPVGTCCYKPPETVPRRHLPLQAPRDNSCVGGRGRCCCLISLEVPLESEPWPFRCWPII